MQLNKNELNKYREAFIRIAKQNALKKMQYLLMSKGTIFEEYSYTDLRKIYSLSEFTIRSSKWPKFLLVEAYKLNLIDGFEKKLSLASDEELIQLDEDNNGEVREFFDKSIREVL